MNITILTTGSKYWMEAHRTGCNHLNRNRSYKAELTGGFAWTEDHETLTSAAESLASDFIAEGSMTVDEALQHIHFSPCVDLPLSEVAIASAPKANRAAAAKDAKASNRLQREHAAGAHTINIDRCPSCNPTPGARKANRIPANATTFICATCHTDKPITSFPTVTGPQDRTTTCRACRTATRAA